MSATHIATQLAVGLGAAAAVVWAFREANADRDRIPLSHGVGLGAVGTGLLVVALSIPLLYGVFAAELIPKGSPLAFIAFLGSFAVANVAAMFAAIIRYNRRHAAGWLTLEGEGRLHVQAGDVDESVALEPGSVRVFPVAGKPQHLQFHLPLAGGRTLLLLAMVPIKDLSMAEQEKLAEPQGLLLASGRHFVDAVRPYLA